LFGAGKPPSVLAIFQIVIPALAFPLIALLIFIVPKRAVDREPVSEHAIHDIAEYRFRKKSDLSGLQPALSLRVRLWA
jgi:hypothetical protein